MANTIISPDMNLPVPVPGVDPGPDYANNTNSCFNIIDSHNHSPGQGVLINPDGLDINADLSIGSNDLTNVAGVDFTSPAPSTVLGRLYIQLNPGGGIYDLFFNDGAGNVIDLTKAGTVNATIGSLPGESYSGGTFTWKQGTGSTTPANFDIGSITIRPIIPGTVNGVTIEAPTGISSEYPLVLPELPTSVKSSLVIDTSGNITTEPLQWQTTVGPGGDYSTISAALSAGKTNIFVYPGTYSESVDITNQVILQGAGFSTIITGSLTVDTGSNNSMISGFQVQGGISITTGVIDVSLMNFWSAAGQTVVDNNLSVVNFIQGFQL